MEVTPQGSLTLAIEQVPSEQGDTFLLEDNLRTNLYNIAFDGSQYKVVHTNKVHVPDEHDSPAHFEE